MKNIHVIPTDKSSRLHKTIDKGLFYLKTNYTSSSKWFNQNIYITSDEEIKEVDFYLDIDLKKVCKNINPNEVSFNTLRKIILTTDQDLIKDGVQAIDDEFLEWFIKNPTCELIEYDKNYNRGNGKYYYKIIIPKEEPNIVMGVFKGLSCEGYNNLLDIKYEKCKQETLAETAERLLFKEGVKLHPSGLETYLKGNVINAMVEIAKWQQEQDAKEIKLLREELAYEKRNKTNRL